MASTKHTRSTPTLTESKKKPSKMALKGVPKHNTVETDDETIALVAFIKKHSEAYYNPHKADEILGDEKTIEDAEFDAAIERLTNLDPEHPLLHTVHKDSHDGFDKVKHIMPMGSQQKAKNMEEFEKWVKKGHGSDEKGKFPKPRFIVQHKLDGLSVELQYKDGQLKYAITRGDGEQGDDITANVRHMKNVPLRLDSKFTGAVRGEIMMDRITFDTHYAPKGHKNPRSMASGLAKTPDAKAKEYGNLHVLVYDAVMTFPKGAKFESEKQKVEFLLEHFEVVETLYINTVERIEELYEEKIALRNKIENIRNIADEFSADDEEYQMAVDKLGGFEIDGLVIKCNVIDMEDMKRAKPNKQIALKFPPTQVVTTLKKVTWQVSGTTYTPIAWWDPVEVSGSMVQKASLCNPGILTELGLRIGSRIVIVKRGDIIPKIEEVLEVGDGEEIKFPTTCVNCKTKLVKTDTKLYCPNKECSNKLLHQIQKWIGTLDVKEFGKELINSIYAKKLVKSLPDLYTLKASVLSELVGKGGKKFGKKNAEKALKNLHDMSSISLPKFIAGFDMDLVGEKVTELLVGAGYDTLDKLFELDAEDIVKVKGIGGKKAEKIIEGLAKNKKVMKEMLKHVSIIENDDEKEDDDDEEEDEAKDDKKAPAKTTLKGLSFCFTGKLEGMGRKDAQEMVKAKGGLVKTAVGGGLTYLVTNDSTKDTKKNLDAKKKGVKVISEDEFVALVS